MNSARIFQRALRPTMRNLSTGRGDALLLWKLSTQHQRLVNLVAVQSCRMGSTMSGHGRPVDVAKELEGHIEKLKEKREGVIKNPCAFKNSHFRAHREIPPTVDRFLDPVMLGVEGSQLIHDSEAPPVWNEDELLKVRVTHKTPTCFVESVNAEAPDTQPAISLNFHFIKWKVLPDLIDYLSKTNSLPWITTIARQRCLHLAGHVIRHDEVSNKVLLWKPDGPRRRASISEKCQTSGSDAISEKFQTSGSDAISEKCQMSGSDAITEKCQTSGSDAISEKCQTSGSDAISEKCQMSGSDAISEKCQTSGSDAISEKCQTSGSDAISEKCQTSGSDAISEKCHTSGSDAISEKCQTSGSDAISEKCHTSGSDAISEKCHTSGSDAISEKCQTSGSDAISEKCHTSGSDAISEKCQTSGSDAISEKCQTSGSDAISEKCQTSGSDAISEKCQTSGSDAISEKCHTSGSDAISEKCQTSGSDAISEKCHTSGSDAISEKCQTSGSDAIQDKSSNRRSGGFSHDHFRPLQVSIYHYEFAYRIVKVLKFIMDTATGFNRQVRTEKMWIDRICFLEAIAVVPPMMGAMTRHISSLRRMDSDHGWIKTLLEEAENERMHLMVGMCLKQPSTLFRNVISFSQVNFALWWLLAYVISPRFCNTFVGYLEEEAVFTYTKCLWNIEHGQIQHWKTMAAPKIAIEYWQLPDDATMKDVIFHIRADEDHHRIVNHTLAMLKKSNIKITRDDANK
ncbi:Alternative oxidase, mitochondrial [Lamellibrachia satsuma]|nr:Alternative oxidase, mitochondrial [Lamellibrachia satsuma]